ncbi:MAG: dihydrolipoyl dehydrogenase [Myxococcales bacterium]|nr:dihydrolipoyl dehydrogenase [Myxococcales bacterium]
MVMGTLTQEVEVVVVGAGPGGYPAAIRAADLGKEVMLIDERAELGGVCLIEGCIPSKALIHATELVEHAREASKFGISFGEITIDIKRLSAFRRSVIDSLTGGISMLCTKRNIEVVKGRARFVGSNQLAVEGGDVASVKFKHCIIATGSRPIVLPTAKDLDLWSSTEALELREVPKRLLVVGGGYIGLELGFVYATLGSEVSVVEMLPSLLTGVDSDLVRFVHKNAKRRFKELMLSTKVTGVRAVDGAYEVALEDKNGKRSATFDRVLVAIGRRPNSENLGLETTNVKVDGRGFIQVDETQRTADPRIFAIGDVVGGYMLAHKATREGKVAAGVIAGHAEAFDNRAIPAVVFTAPEVAWAGLTEAQAAEEKLDVTIGRFPLTALGRAKAMGQTDGMVKMIADRESQLILGVGIVGPHASELVAEAALAIEMGATLVDLEATIHPHPTISESLMEAAEVALGLPVHTLPPR